MEPGTIANNVYSPVARPLSEVLSPLIPVRERGIGKILVPTNFSEYSDTALQLAIDLARQQNARIHLLHVLRFRDPDNRLVRLMQEQIARFADAKDIEINPEIRKGKIPEEILNAEAEEKPDIIIMSRHREGNSLLSLFRSITAKVRKKARCSVLVVGA